MTTIRTLPTEALTRTEVGVLHDLLWAAWQDDPEAFTDEDWEHALGGMHVISGEEGEIVSHAAVVRRELHVGDLPLPTGYVEAVATRPDRRGRGHATAVMRAVGEHIDRGFRLGALDTSLRGFYERIGWLRWKGPTYVRTDSGPVRTPEDDGGVMVRRTPTSPAFDLAAPISCEWRSGDVW